MKEAWKAHKKTTSAVEEETNKGKNENSKTDKENKDYHKDPSYVNV